MFQMVEEKNCSRWWRRRSVPDGGGVDVFEIVYSRYSGRRTTLNTVKKTVLKSKIGENVPSDGMGGEDEV